MTENLPQTFSAWLQLGQKLESEGSLFDALSAYDRAISLIVSTPTARDVSDRRALGIAWMNRGNALQKLVGAESHANAAPESLRAYDEAIALFESLPYETDPRFRNHLGAAWLNRGHASLVAGDLSAAAKAFQQAVALLQSLPLEADPGFRLNLAGAWTNLAHATFASAPDTAIEAARNALAALGDTERAHEAFAAMSLRSRRALVMAIGELLSHGTDGAAAFANDATDTIEDGLAIAREFESRGISTLRPLAARLFRLGTQIYRMHQPQFLAEFVLEVFFAPSIAADPEFRAAADTALAGALSDLQRPQLFVAGTPESDRRREIAQSLRAAQERLLDAVPPAGRV